MATDTRHDYCIVPNVDWFGRTDGPVPVYCATTLAPVGRTDGPVARTIDGNFLGSFHGCEFSAVRAGQSLWYAFEAPTGR